MLAVSGNHPWEHIIITMRPLISLCLAAVLVASAYAAGGGSYSGNNPHGGYSGGYGHGRGRGKGRHIALLGEEPLTIVDKLYERVKDVHDQVKTYSEQVDALLARLAIQEKKVKELVLVIIVELRETDMGQNFSIDLLNEHLHVLKKENITLYDHVHELYVLNTGNTQLQFNAEVLWAKERRVIVEQEREINTLYSAISTLKTKLFQVQKNKFEVFYDRVERGTTLLGGVNKRETRRMCENGQVTLTSIDGRVEYQYQNWFDNVPGILWGLAGFNFNLDTREDPAHYGYGYPPKEPEAIGARVNAYSTKAGIILEVFGLSFGDTSMVSVDVAFQACTIGPGTDPVDH